ncbi:MAG: hypothetical protein JSR45_02690 [Proteobacteria bacterium]|nr:hypothetical protein [Pseudomonadota bacterium]
MLGYGLIGAGIFGGGIRLDSGHVFAGWRGVCLWLGLMVLFAGCAGVSLWRGEASILYEGFRFGPYDRERAPIRYWSIVAFALSGALAWLLAGWVLFFAPR